MKRLIIPALVALCLTTTVHAAFVIIEIDGVQVSSVENGGNLGYIQDGGNDGTWDSVFLDDSMRVGDGFTSVDRRLMGAVEFNIDSYRTQIAAATSITFDAQVWFKTNTPDFTLQAFGFNTTATENGTVATNDATTPATLLSGTYTAAALAGGQWITFDATSNVKADGVEAANNWAGFRLDSPDASVYDPGNGQDSIAFNVARLSITTPPEIAVSGNSVNIADGDASPSLLDLTDFGTTTVGSPFQHTFRVDNSGTGALTTSGLTLPGGFSLIEGLSASIAAGGFDTFTVQLDALLVGTYSGQISFTNNDPDENPFNFSITGTVVPTPAALPVGLAMLGLITMRRRRA